MTSMGDDLPIDSAGQNSMGRRVKSKMKKSDPSEWSIQDFLAECKNADAADERFEDTPEKEQMFEFVAYNDNGKLGDIYEGVSRYLRKKLKWKKKKDSKGRFHLILGAAQGSGIPFRRFGQLIRAEYGIRPHCNYYRGFQCVTKKSQLVSTFRTYEETSGWDASSVVPETFCFFPSKPDENETDEFRTAFESSSKSGKSNVWILKPSDGAHGRDIVIMDDYDEIIDFLEKFEKGTPPWVVQRYITNPLLLNGGRKFDMRFWVLLDHNYDVYIYEQGVCRTCSPKFTIDDLTDKFAHLSNHGLQESHRDFGAYESGNEMFTDAFAKWLSSNAHRGGTVYQDEILPQVKEIIYHTLQAGKTNMEIREVCGSEYSSFQVFGFDLMVDEDLKVWLIEANASPAVADDIRRDFVRDLVHVAILPKMCETETPQDTGFQLIELDAPSNKK